MGLFSKPQSPGSLSSGNASLKNVEIVRAESLRKQPSNLSARSDNKPDSARAEVYADAKPVSSTQNPITTPHPNKLMLAAQQGRTGSARMLLARQNTAQLNAKNAENGKTSLLYAVQASNHKMAEMLLDSGADPNISGADGLTALHTAVMASVDRVSSCLALLLKAKRINLDLPTKNGETALMLAITSGKTDALAAVTKQLIDAGADRTLTNSNCETALQLAWKHGVTAHDAALRTDPPVVGAFASKEAAAAGEQIDAALVGVLAEGATRWARIHANTAGTVGKVTYHDGSGAALSVEVDLGGEATFLKGDTAKEVSLKEVAALGVLLRKHGAWLQVEGAADGKASLELTFGNVTATCWQSQRLTEIEAMMKAL